MNTVIDTLRYSEKLRSAGFVTEQANALAWALNDEVGEQLATKSDIKEVNRSIEDIHRTIEDIRKTFDMKFEVLNMKIENLENRFNFLFGLIALLVVLELIPVVKPLFG